MRGTLNLNISLHWEFLNRYTSSTLVPISSCEARVINGFQTYWFGVFVEKSIRDLIHGGKIAHVIQKYVDFDNAFQRRAGLLQDSSKISQRLSLRES